MRRWHQHWRPAAWRPAAWIVALSVMSLEISTAWAQYTPPQQGPAALPEKPATWAWVIGGAFLAFSLVVAFKNPKRSHQD